MKSRASRSLAGELRRPIFFTLNGGTPLVGPRDRPYLVRPASDMGSQTGDLPDLQFFSYRLEGLVVLGTVVPKKWAKEQRIR